MKTQLKLALFLLPLLPVALSAATVVNVDFSRDPSSPLGGVAGALQVGTGPAPDTGTFWNDYSVYLPATGGDEGANTIVNPYLVSNLTASDGVTPTTIDVSLSSGWFRAFNGTATGINDLQQEWVFADLGHLATLTVGGLDTSLSYDLYLVCSAGNQPTDYTIGTTTRNATGIYSQSDISLWTEGAQYVLFSGIAPDGSGNIAIGVQDGAAPITGNGNIAAMQIVSVPEPSTSLLLLGSLVGLALRRRR